MHPMERLRYVARGGGAGCSVVAGEAAGALGGLVELDAGAVLTAARRLLDFHPACGPLWWVCAHVLAAEDPYLAASFAAAELDGDATARHVGRLLEERAVRRVAVLVRPGEQLAPALALARLRSVRVAGDGWAMRRVAAELDDTVTGDVVCCDAASAVRRADLALCDTLAAGPSSLLAVPGGAAFVEAAAAAGVPLAAVGGVGKLLPASLFDLLVSRAAPAGPAEAPAYSSWWDEPGLREGDLVDAGRFEVFVGPDGATGDLAAAPATCPVPVELLRRAR